MIFVFCLSSLFVMSGCSQTYDQKELAIWFQENIIDEDLYISKTCTEKENASGGIDTVWQAHLKDLPEVSFELIDRERIQLFRSHEIVTTYHQEMGKYYSERFQNEYPAVFEGLTLGVPTDSDIPSVNGMYSSFSEIQTLCEKMEKFEAYLDQQPYPCLIRYGIAYQEPLTFIADNGGPSEEAFIDRQTYIFLENDDPQLKEDTLSSLLQEWSENSFANYALAYQIELESYPDELKKKKTESDQSSLTIVRSDETEIQYADLFLTRESDLSFGCFFEVLKRDGSYEVQGSASQFSFTATDGSRCAFSYSFQEACSPTSYNDWQYSKVFYYTKNDEKILLDHKPVIFQDLFQELTGDSYRLS